jgi:acyl-CoA thioesterase
VTDDVGGPAGPRPDIPGFDAVTAIRPTGESGHYTAVTDPGWSVAGRSHGGVLLALATRAALAEAGQGHEHPLAVTGAFAAAVPIGPVGVQVEVLRHGRTTSVLRVLLRAGEPAMPCLEAVVTAGRLQDDEPLVPGPPCPQLPPEQDCPLLSSDRGRFTVPLCDAIHQRMDPATLGFASGRPSGAGELRAWVRFADGRDPDPLSLVCLGDALPPPSFEVPGLQMTWVPTLQLSAFVRAAPVPGPLVVRTVARSVGGGAVDETCDLWDADGRLVAVVHQLAAVRTLDR